MIDAGCKGIDTGDIMGVWWAVMRDVIFHAGAAAPLHPRWVISSPKPPNKAVGFGSGMGSANFFEVRLDYFVAIIDNT